MRWRRAEDLRPLFEAGAALASGRCRSWSGSLTGPRSATEGALVGIAGEMEHGGACMHPMLGHPMRAAVGGGQAVISS
ncbi:MAG: amino acid synthesis family protein [Alphaproteobacteria bacterium]